jgi:hypothetical protein
VTDAHSDRFTVHCPSCHSRLGVPRSAAGRKAKCPKCEHRFIIPEAASPAQPPLDTHSAEEPHSPLEELARDEREAAAAAHPAGLGAQTACPQCGAAMPSGARICVSCGYDVQTGRTHKVARTQPMAAARAAKAAGTFLLGTLFSAVGALIGAIVWCAVAIITEFEIGWIAWGLGILAGVGMRFGYRKENVRAGLVAAGIALAGIVAAKGMIVAYFLWPAYSAASSELEKDNLLRWQMRLTMTDQILQSRGLTSDSADEQALDSAYAEADALLDEFSDEDVRERFWIYADSVRVCDIATSDREVLNRNTLAAHRAELRAGRAGLAYRDAQRAALYREELIKVNALSDADLEDALAARNEWNAGTMWADPDFVRDYLVYSRCRETLEERSPTSLDQLLADAEKLAPADWLKQYMQAPYAPTPEEWQKIHGAAVAEVDAIPDELRSSQAQELYADRQNSRKEFLEVLERMPPPTVLVLDSLTKEASKSILRDMFGVFDILFAFLALGSAYKIAAGGGGE